MPRPPGILHLLEPGLPGKVAEPDGPDGSRALGLGGVLAVTVRDLGGGDGVIGRHVRIASEWPSARIGTIDVHPVEDELSLDRRYR